MKAAVFPEERQKETGTSWFGSNQRHHHTKPQVLDQQIGFRTASGKMGNRRNHIIYRIPASASSSTNWSQFTCSSSSTGTQVSTQQTHRNTGLLDGSRLFEAQSRNSLQRHNVVLLIQKPPSCQNPPPPESQDLVVQPITFRMGLDRFITSNVS